MAHMMQFDGKNVLLPTTVTNTQYMEWDVRANRTDYSVVRDGEDWFLLRRSDAGDWEEIGLGDAVDTFLRDHNFVLAD